MKSSFTHFTVSLRLYAFSLAAFTSTLLSARAEEGHRDPASVALSSDEGNALDCFTVGKTPHVCVLMRLAKIEDAFEADLEKTMAEYSNQDAATNKLADNHAYLARINAITDKYQKLGEKLRGDIIQVSQKKKIKGLELLANFEIDRLLVEQRSRLAIMCLPDKEAAKAQIARAEKSIASTWESFKHVPAAERENTPGLLNRLVQTRLNILELGQNATNNPAKLDTGYKMRTARDFLAQARGLKPNTVEDAELDMTELDTYISNSHAPGLGAQAPESAEDTRAPGRMDELIDKLSRKEAAVGKMQGQEAIVAQLKLMNVRARFYAPEHHKDAVAYLEAGVKSTDLATQKISVEAMKNLFGSLAGTGESYDLLQVATRNANVPGVKADEMAMEFSQRNQASNKAINESLGALENKLQLPSYQRVMENQAELGDSYLRLTHSLGRLSNKLQEIKKTGGSEMEMKTAYAAVDLDWISLQCADIAARGLVSQPESALKKATPLSKYTVNFSSCLGAKDPKTRNRVVGEISRNAVNRDLYKNEAWLIGNFVFDVGMIAVTGGIGNVVSKGIQGGFRIAGTAMLERYAYSTAIKVGVRAASFATKLVVGDIIGQTMGGAKNFIAIGLQTGEWDAANAKPGFLQADFKPGPYALRMMAAQIAVRAPWAILGKVGQYAMKSEAVQEAVENLSQKGNRMVAGSRPIYTTLGKNLLLEPVKGQINDFSSNALQSGIGVDKFKGAQRITNVDDWLGRYRGILLSVPGGKLGDKFADRLRTLPPRYYSELASAGKCLLATETGANGQAVSQ